MSSGTNPAGQAEALQSARDHAVDEAAALHREELADEQTQRQKQLQQLLEMNTTLTKEVKALTDQIHAAVAHAP
jgi:cell division protein FtsB